MTPRKEQALWIGSLLMAAAIAVLWSAPAFALSSRTLISPTGAAAGDQLGNSVSGAGDVNGDGYADVIVGAPNNDAAGLNAGRAYVYYGGPGADGVPDLTLSGVAAGDQFGTSVSGAGDVNGDGYADVIVGAPGNDAAGPDVGRAYVYYGGPGADAVPDLILTGVYVGFASVFGTSVSGAGDVNGDGYADMIVGAPQAGVGPVAGRAYVYFGGPGADAVADLTLTGAAQDDYFGGSVSGAGDVNGDGYADVIVGTPYNDAGGMDAGRAYVYYGGPGADAVADLTLTGVAAGDHFGNSVSGAGDLNGDGYEDVIVGAPPAGSGAGRAYVYFGGPGADAVADLTLTGAAAGDYFGWSVSGAGDVNGDGYADVIVGANLNDAGGTDAGRAYVYYGGPGADAVADLTLTGAAAGDYFGISVSGAGDVNGDSYADVIVGAIRSNTGGGAGRAYLTLVYPYEVLSPNGGEQWVTGETAVVRWLGHDPTDVALSVDGGASYRTLASGVGGGEENEVKVIVPSPATTLARIRVSETGAEVRHSTSDVSDGVFQVVSPVTPTATASRLQHTYVGVAAGDSYGSSVGTAGDVNGDGYPDVIVGAQFNDAGGIDAGRAYVYFGGPKSDNGADLILTGAAANDWFGWSVGTAGDVNGDGYPDLMVGAPGNDAGGADAGRAYVYYGGPGADAVADLVLTGAAAGDWFGWSVGTAGDVNGDGYADVIVGAPNNDAAGTDAGRAYVYFGGPGADNVADLVLTGAAAGDNFGVSVAKAGDMNGDRFSDVIVGAYLNKAGGANAGRAYVYYGGPSPDALADLVFTGGAGNNFGAAVAGAGDVNGDGYADAIVGADTYAGGSDVGRAYVFFGGPGADSLPDMTLTGTAPGDFFGAAVGTAGDVNGDGFADVIVGAYGSDAGGTDAGRAYVYYGGPGADAVADLTFTGLAGDNLGNAVGAAGDMNGDGFPDLIVGARQIASTGTAYIYDVNRYQLLSPVGGETWNVGASKTITWLGAEKADLWLSTDAGRSFDRIASSAGGLTSNTWNLRVPHSPGKFTMVKLTPTDTAIEGFDQSDSMFTIQTSVALLALLAAPAPDQKAGALVTWSTDPGPADLAGYRLERSSGGSSWGTAVALSRETSYYDPGAGPATRYRLYAVNGFGEELMLGETLFRPAAALAAWPLPYRAGNLSIAFATAGGLGGGPGSAVVSVYDASGRLVRNVARGQYSAGYQAAIWDGRDEHGRRVAAGVYFLKAAAAGEEHTMKLVVVR